MPKSKVVFCITCKGRAPHVLETLPQNLAHNPDATFVLLDYNSGDGLVNDVVKRHADEMNNGRLVIYSCPDPQVFHMAHAKNMAHRLGIREGADILVNLDADNFTGPGFSQWLRWVFIRQPDNFAWANMVKGEMDRGITGRIAVTRNAFLMAGGYDEKYNTWSPDDEDFKCRLRMLGINSIGIPKQFLRALKHPDKMRFREYPHVALDCYDKPKVHPAAAVVNGGDVGCGKVFRNACAKPIWIDPIPTRIFGIGMHKTGTSSLHEAFRILGFNAHHWNNALWARAIWEQVAEGRSSIVERHYAFSDLPFPLLYASLDALYPGSKFILTVREIDNWIRSVRNHWNPDVNPWCKEWDIAPFTHKLHQMMYGRKTFDEAIFRARYRAHNKNVLEYFKNRPNDLLILSMDDYKGSVYKSHWEPLCKFLDRPIPPVTFPHALQTAHYKAVDYQI